MLVPLSSVNSVQKLVRLVLAFCTFFTILHLGDACLKVTLDFICKMRDNEVPYILWRIESCDPILKMFCSFHLGIPFCLPLQFY